MSKIEKLEKELYNETKDEDLDKRMQHREYVPGTLQKPPLHWGEKAEPPKEPEENYFKKSTIIKIVVSVFVVLFMVIGALFFFLYLGSGGTEMNVSILAPSPIESGDVITIPITVKNISKNIIREGELSIVLPESSLLVENGQEHTVPPRYAKKIDDFNPGEERTFEIQARMFGHEGEQKQIEAVVLYRPENVSARFSAKGTQSIIIGRVPLAVAWELPDLLSSGQELLFKVRYSSSAKEPFNNLSLRLTYPPGFSFTSANPSPDVDQDIWKIGTLDPSKEGSILIRGSVAGEEGEIKALHAELGVYNDLTKEWTSYSDSLTETHIAVSPLSVQGFYDQSRDKAITPGDSLVFTVHYKNNTPYVIKNVTVRAFLTEAPATFKNRVLDFQGLQIDKGGVLDGVTNAIVWGPGSVPELQQVDPGKEGTFTFRITTKDQAIMRSNADKELSINLHSTTEAAGVPEELRGTRLSAQDSVSFKVKTKVLFTGRAVYRESPIANTGPIPPRVGQKTSYTIVWEVKNFTNTLKNVEITTTLPPNIKWENSISPLDARISFDPAAQEVHWHLGDVKPGVGILTPTLVGVFQVSIIPSEADRGDAVVLTGDSTFSGVDSFINEPVEAKIPRFSTELREDSLTTQDDWKVVK